MSLHAAEYGPAEAPTIVLLHGGGGAGWMWRPQIEALGGDYHVLVPDLPGSGESVGTGPFTMERAAEEVAGLVTARAHGGRATVVGLSEGAQTVVQLLATTPAVVDRAIVSSALVRPLPGGGLNSERMLRWTYRTSVAPLKGADWWVRLNMRHSAGIPDEYFDDFARGFRALTEDDFVAMLLANQAFRLPAGLGGAAAPVLVVVGAREYEAMKASAHDIAAALPDAVAYQVRHARKHSRAEEHNWSMTEPELFTRMVRAWVEQSPLPPELVTL
jgi:pimeloyl-ACP methyl ester carboxylesterase